METQEPVIVLPPDCAESEAPRQSIKSILAVPATPADDPRRLIAAAPDLLYACQIAREAIGTLRIPGRVCEGGQTVWDHFRGPVDLLNNTIAKATGHN